jgi:hypothetical protein
MFAENNLRFLRACLNFNKEFCFVMAKAEKLPFLNNPDINVGVIQTQEIIGL